MINVNTKHTHQGSLVVRPHLFYLLETEQGVVDIKGEKITPINIRYSNTQYCIAR